jgi:hypothetical protein
MSAIGGPTVVSFVLTVSGQQPVTFAELGEARSAIANIKGVLRGATPKQTGQVVLREGGSSADAAWLTLWQQAAQSQGAQGRRDFSVLVVAQPGDKTIARFDATSGWPTSIVVGTANLQKVAFSCATLQAKYS